MKEIKLECIRNGYLVHIKETILFRDPVFFKTEGQAIAYIKRRLTKWKII